MLPNIRRCISCRCLAPKSDFWRVVRLAGLGQVQIQPITISATGDQLMGRSAYLCPQADCLQTAQKKNRLAKTLKTQVPNDIYTQLWQKLELER